MMDSSVVIRIVGSSVSISMWLWKLSFFIYFFGFVVVGVRCFCLGGN